jgi:hypothetical protein
MLDQIAEKAIEKVAEATEKVAEGAGDVLDQKSKLEVDDLPNGMYDCADNLPELSDDLDEESIAEDVDGVSAADVGSSEGVDVNDVNEKAGGAYKDLPARPGHEKHHVPAHDSTEIPFNDGPCIVMDKADHRETASCGNSREAREYREKQRELINEGKFDEALQMDIDDVRSKFGDKYDEAIAQAKEYVEELKSQGRLS